MLFVTLHVVENGHELFDPNIASGFPGENSAIVCGEPSSRAP